MHVVKLIRDFSLPTGQAVVEPDRKVRPVKLVVIRNGVRFLKKVGCVLLKNFPRFPIIRLPDRVTTQKGPLACLR